MRAVLTWLIEIRLHLFLRQDVLASEAKRLIGVGQIGTNGDPLVEDEAVTLVEFSPTLLEVVENSTIQLQDVSESTLFHPRTCLLATDTTRAEHQHRLLFPRLRQLVDRLWEVAKVIDLDGMSILKGADIHLVVVANVEQLERPTIAKPLSEFFGSDLGGGVVRGIDLVDPKSDDLFFEFDQHAPKRLIVGPAFFGMESLKARKGLQPFEELPSR